MANLYVVCSLLMATLFLISASLQFNDSDWYFWIPLYVGAAYMNLMNLIGIVSYDRALYVRNLVLCLGQFLLGKVFWEGGMVGILSMDMRDRLVRSKMGGILVVLCMILQISASSEFHRVPARKMKMEVAPATKNGMAILVCVSYGLSTVFLMYHKREMKL